MPPIENNPEIRNKINELWENVTTVDTFFAKRDPTDEECEQAAQVCEEWCKMYPVYFPKRNFTRKIGGVEHCNAKIYKREEGVHENSFAFGTRR